MSFSLVALVCVAVQYLRLRTSASIKHFDCGATPLRILATTLAAMAVKNYTYWYVSQCPVEGCNRGSWHNAKVWSYDGEDLSSDVRTSVSLALQLIVGSYCKPRPPPPLMFDTCQLQPARIMTALFGGLISTLAVQGIHRNPISNFRGRVCS